MKLVLVVVLTEEYETTEDARAAILEDAVPGWQTEPGEEFLLLDKDDEYAVVEKFTVPADYTGPEDPPEDEEPAEDPAGEDEDAPVVAPSPESGSEAPAPTAEG